MTDKQAIVLAQSIERLSVAVQIIASRCWEAMGTGESGEVTSMAAEVNRTVCEAFPEITEKWESVTGDADIVREALSMGQRLAYEHKAEWVREFQYADEALGRISDELTRYHAVPSGTGDADIVRDALPRFHVSEHHDYAPGHPARDALDRLVADIERLTAERDEWKNEARCIQEELERIAGMA
jgi:hypothetical protein